MPMDDFYSVLPPPDAGPDVLGLPPPPQVPPQQPLPGLVSDEPRQKLLAVMAAIAGVAGGRGAQGAIQGVLQGQARGDAMRMHEADRIRLENQRAQLLHQQQAEQYQQAAARRQQALMGAVQSMRAKVETLPTKAAYDVQVEGFANFLRGLGYRVDANWLRQSVPYGSPDVQARAAEALATLLKNPNVEQLWKTQPEVFAKTKFPFKLDPNGPDNNVTGLELSTLAKQSFGINPVTGQPEFAQPDTSLEDRAKAEFFLKELVKKDRAERVQATPDRMIELGQQAIRLAEEAKPPKEPDPMIQEMRALRLQEAQFQRANRPALPPQVQRRIDVKVRSFDQQPVVKRIQTMAEGVTFVESLGDRTDNPADDEGLIYAFAKVMDPESVVREGEYATVQKYSQSWMERFGFAAQRVVDNVAFLTPEARRNLKNTIRARFAAAQPQYENVRRSYARQIEAIAGPGTADDHLIDYGAAFPAAPGAASPATTPSSTTTPDTAREKYRARERR